MENQRTIPDRTIIWEQTVLHRFQQMIFDRIRTFSSQYINLLTNMCAHAVQRSLKKNRYIIKEYIKQHETQP